MNIKNWTENKNSLFQQRILPAFIMVFFFFIFIGILRFAYFYSFSFSSKVIISTRAISLLLMFGVAFWAMLELNKAFLENKYVSVIFAFAISAYTVFFNGPIFSKYFVYSTEKFALSENYLSMFSVFYFNYWFWVKLVITSLLFLVLRIVILSKSKVIVSGILLKLLLYFVANFVIWSFIYCVFIFSYMPSGFQNLIIFTTIASFYDVGGFFGGKFLGTKIIKRPFSPFISPSKTWEGALVGLVFSIVFVFVEIFLANVIEPNKFNLAQVILNVGSSSFNGKLFGTVLFFIVFAPVVSMLGDLLFSLIKRVCLIKDFSKILKGHGGILDRIDGIASVFALWSFLMVILYFLNYVG